MILPVYLYGHPVLRKVSEKIEKNYEGLHDLIANMKETMYASDGIGIAAPQVGVNIRVIYIDVDVLADSFPELKGKSFVLINPELTVDDTARVIIREEGCLSLPEIHENVPRHEKIHLKWFDEDWTQHEEDFEGYLSRVMQHEYDHLDGIVFVDRISAIRKQLIHSKLNNIVKGKVDCDYRTKAFKPSHKK
jgi:peptide deformylase